MTTTTDQANLVALAARQLKEATVAESGPGDIRPMMHGFNAEGESIGLVVIPTKGHPVEWVAYAVAVLNPATIHFIVETYMTTVDIDSLDADGTPPPVGDLSQRFADGDGAVAEAVVVTSLVDGVVSTRSMRYSYDGSTVCWGEESSGTDYAGIVPQFLTTTRKFYEDSPEVARRAAMVIMENGGAVAISRERMAEIGLTDA
jgi:hypothetical protein